MCEVQDTGLSSKQLTSHWTHGIQGQYPAEPLGGREVFPEASMLW
jgi:hypothetical protein